MKIQILYILILMGVSQISFATVYLTDQFGIHKLCINDPWVALNATPAYHGSSTSTFPCHYDYAIVHVPTLQQEINAQIINSSVSVNLKINDPLILEFPQPDWTRFKQILVVIKSR